MKIKTSDLTGAALDWAVAKCEGVDDEAAALFHDEGYYNYSTNWSQGGPIIEREGCCLYLYGDSEWVSHLCNKEYRGPTPLIAAMRCYVASKLGDEVEVPEGLL